MIILIKQKIKLPRIFVLILGCFLSLPVGAFHFDTTLTEGVLTYGQLDIGENLYIESNQLRIGMPAGEWTKIPKQTDGRFVMAVPQDAKQVKLKIMRDDVAEERIFSVQGRSWDEEIVKGLPPQKVEPNLKDQERITTEAILIQKVRQKPSFDGKIPSNWIRPVLTFKRISSSFGSRRLLNGAKKQGHSGTDYAAPTGTPIVAPAEGVVRLIHPDMFFSGKTVVIDHGLGVFSSYSHLNKIDVRENQVVKQGTPIGQVGMSGRATGPHLHWTVTWFGVRVDPETLIKKD